MKRGDRLPGDQAGIVFSDRVIEQLDDLTSTQRIDVVAEIVRLCGDPAGKHPLSKALAGWNTTDVLQGDKRVVYKVSERDDVGLIEVLCLGPRSDSEVYDVAVALVESEILSAEDVTQIWQALHLLDVVAEKVGLDGWDFRPPPAPEGMIRAAVSSGLLSEEVARLLSKDEVQAAMERGWNAQGADPMAALRAALERARTNVEFRDPAAIIEGRADDRCDALMPRTQRRCIRRAGHPGAHRASP